RRERPGRAWPEREPGEHVYRPRGRWPRHRARAHRAGGLGSHQPPAGAADRRFPAHVEYILDRLTGGECARAEDRDVPELAASGGCRRRAPPECSQITNVTSFPTAFESLSLMPVNAFCPTVLDRLQQIDGITFLTESGGYEKC